MASIDQLQIDIVAQDKASATLNDLSKSIESLGNAIERLDAGKMTSFAKAVDRLTGIGANTNVTAKGIKNFASEISKAFDIRSKKGIDDIKTSLQALYEVHKQAEQGMDVGNMYTYAQKGIQQAIESNYKYKESMDSTTRAVKEYVEATNQSGTKVGMADMMQEFGENFKEMSSILGGAFKNNLSSAQEGVMDLAEYLSEMNAQLGTQFDTQNVEKGFADLVSMMRNAKDVILDFKEASQKGLISEDDTFGAVLDVTDKIAALYKEQEKYNATNGLGGIVSVLSQLSNIQVPDLTPFISATQEVSKNAPQMQTVSKGVSDIGQAANEATAKVESLNEALTQSKTIIEGQEPKEYGFTMKDAPQPQNIQYPPMVVEQAQAFEEKLLPAIIDTENEISNLYQRMMNVSSVEAAYDAITEKFVEWKTQLMEMNGAISGDKWIVPEFKGNADFSKQQVGWISDIKPEVVEGYFYQIEDAANKCLPAIQNVGTTALALPEQFKTSTEYINQCFETMKSEVSDVGTNAPESFKKVEQGAQEVTSEIQKAIEAARTFKQVLSDMESGKIDFNKEAYDKAVKGFDKASEAVRNYKDELLGKNQPEGETGEMADVLENVNTLGEALEQVGHKLNGVGDKLISLFKTLTTPFRGFANEYIEKFKAMEDHVANFQKNFKAHMAKVSAFWKRTMKTFTFMIVRKVFTAVIKEVGNAVQTLAMYSRMMGTAFNSDISLMVADFQYLGRSIVSIFAPLINIVAPIIDALVNKIATLLSYIGMLIAALGGKATFSKAKKNVGDYAKSLDKASKSAKNLTMGIDELNILAESSGGSSNAFDGFEDAFEEVDIPDWIKDLGNWLKDLFHKFFDPLKEAWDRAKQYVIDGFKTMVDSLSRLFGHILDDFFTMWNEEKTIHMFEQIFRIIGDIFRVIRNLANQLDKAWQKGKVGLQIFRNLRDIMYELVEHARNISYYMIGWADNIDFSPLLESFELMTRKMVKLADFVGGVFEDAMINGVLKYIQWMIEHGIPHLQETIAKVLDAFSFDALRVKLKPLWSAFEEVIQNLHTGMTNALGNLGLEIARFTNSKEFNDFLQRLVDIAQMITAERVEKVLTGIGKGILAIAKAVVKFVNSKPFMAFLQALADLVDNHSVDQIAGIFEKIAGAIAAFKFGAFAAEKLSGFFKFVTVITAWKNLATIAGEFTSLGGGLSAAGKGLGIFVNSGAGLGAVIGGLSLLASLFVEFKGVKEVIGELADGTEVLGSSLAKMIAPLTYLFSVGQFLPAQIIAVAGAISGIKDSLQGSFDNVFGALLSEGETTIAQVKDWYAQTTSTIRENADKWKDIQRNLTQDKGDLEEYSHTLETLEAALDSSVQATTSMTDKLTAKYNDMTTAINNYVDQSTEALAQELIENRDYYESKGKNVDEMIGKLYENAEKEKEVYNSTQEVVNQAAEAYSKAVDTYGKNSDKAKEAYTKYQDAINKHIKEIDKYRSATEKVDTSEAVRQIEKLGKSLDLSQYSNWNDAAADIKGGIDEINAQYESGLSEVEETLQTKLELLQNQFKEGRIDLSTLELGTEAAKTKYQEDIDSLTRATSEALGFFDEQLAAKLQEVQANAEAEWDKSNPLKHFFMAKDKDAYVNQQMQTYVDEILGETGLTGSLQEAFSKLPGDVEPTATASITQLVNDSTAALQAESGTWFDNIKSDLGTRASTLFDEAKTSVETSITEFKESIPGFLEDLPENIGLTLGFALGKFTEWGESIVTWGAENIPGIIDDLKDKFDIAAKIKERLLESVEKFNDWKAKVEEWSGMSVPEIAKKIGQDLYDQGVNIVQGLIDGVKAAWEQLKGGIDDFCKSFVQGFKDALGISSPAKETEEIGEYSLEGLLLPFTGDQTSRLQGFLDSFLDVFRVQLSPDKFTAIGESVIQGVLQPISSSNGRFVSAVGQIFSSVTQAVQENMQILGVTMMGLMQTFSDTYILPFFNLDQWQPLFDNLMNVVFIPFFETFSIWFTEEAMTPWWEEQLLTWFEAEKWNEELFDPLQENIQEHWDVFSTWWDTTMNEWWENQVKPWFEKGRWTEQFNTILEVAKEVFNLIKEAIKERIDEAADAVKAACTEMKTALEEILQIMDEIIRKSSGMKGMKITFDAKEFASGGFPNQGSLFFANEAGAELVGTVRGRTAVASNQEITGIADAVYATGNTESELLSQLISIGRQMLDKDPVVFTDKDIARMNNSGQGKLGMGIIS